VKHASKKRKKGKPAGTFHVEKMVAGKALKFENV
jgi:hypothetical protein